MIKGDVLEQCSLGIGYYTQLVWQNTTHVGCGWSQFQYRGFAVIVLAYCPVQIMFGFLGIF